jgi:hypothetical protein
MIRPGLILAVLLVGTSPSTVGISPATAQPGPPTGQERPGPDDQRYTFHQTDGGYVRLDSRTGQVSFCLKQPAGWQCQSVPDERTALESEIARLQTDNAALKAELLSRNLPLPGTIKPSPPEAKGGEPRIALPSDAELNRVMSYVEKIWRRLVEVMGSTQKNLLPKDSPHPNVSK